MASLESMALYRQRRRSPREGSSRDDARSIRALGLPPPPWIVGHRGACGEAPENTIESFQRAISDGAHMIELDLQLTSDRRLVAAHDGTLRRVAGQRLRVEESSLEELRRANVAAHFPGAPPARIPTLEEILEVLPPAFPVNLELKCRRASREHFARVLAEAIHARGHLLLSSFDFRLLAEVKRVLPNRPLAPVGRHGLPRLSRAARRLGAASLHTRADSVSCSLLGSAAELGVPVLCYTVNRIETARRLFGVGVSGIFTDFPRRFADAKRLDGEVKADLRRGVSGRERAGRD